MPLTGTVGEVVPAAVPLSSTVAVGRRGPVEVPTGDGVGDSVARGVQVVLPDDEAERVAAPGRVGVPVGRPVPCGVRVAVAGAVREADRVLRLGVGGRLRDAVRLAVAVAVRRAEAEGDGVGEPGGVWERVAAPLSVGWRPWLQESEGICEG